MKNCLVGHVRFPFDLRRHDDGSSVIRQKLSFISPAVAGESFERALDTAELQNGQQLPLRKQQKPANLKLNDSRCDIRPSGGPKQAEY